MNLQDLGYPRKTKVRTTDILFFSIIINPSALPFSIRLRTNSTSFSKESVTRVKKKKKNPKEEKLLFVCYNLRASRGALTSIFFADLFWLARRTSPKRSDCSKVPSDPGHQVRDHWSNTWFTFRVQSCDTRYAFRGRRPVKVFKTQNDPFWSVHSKQPQLGK